MSRCFHTLLVVFVIGVFPTGAFAKPKVAVAPLEGDSDGKVSEVVATEASAHAKVIGPDEVGRIMESLGITEAHSARATKKLRVRLEVVAVIHGKIERSGSKKKLELTVSTRGKKPQTFEIEFKTASSKSFHKELRDALERRIATPSDSDREDASDDDEPKKKISDDDDKPKKSLSDDDNHPKKRAVDDDDGPKKRHSDDDDKPKKRKSDDDDRPKKRVADDEESTRARKHSDDDDDARPSHKKKRRHHDTDGDDQPERHPVTQAAAWLDAGGSGTRRTLTFTTDGTVGPPPRVGTLSFAAQLEGELYPGALSDMTGPAGNIGVFGSASKTFGLSIAIPGKTESAPIKEGHYTIGARYRFVFGQSSLAIGASYWKHYYTADRSSLAMPSDLDMPDVEYSAVAPGAQVKIAAAPNAAVFATVDVPLMLSTGALGTTASYGRASAIAFAVEGGIDYALDTHYGLRFAGVFDQVGLTFARTNGSMALARSVIAATDRTMGVLATFAMVY